MMNVSLNIISVSFDRTLRANFGEMRLVLVKLSGLFICMFGLLLISSLPAQAQAQTGTITGTVTDAETGNPLPGVNVVLEDTQRGAATNAQGEYAIAGVESGTYTLQASFVGYGEEAQEGVEVQADQATTADFAMQRAAVGLDEVVAIGYGEQQRRDLTGSVSSISADEIEETPVTAPNEILQGRVAGVQATQASNAPGGGLSVRVRGSGSVQGGNEPLYVIDGVPVTTESNGTPAEGNVDVHPNPLSSINPSDIASIEVLKDASSTAIYGARGANGVVLITTKSGREGRTEVSFDTYVGTQRVANEPDVLNARQYVQLLNEVAENEEALELPPAFSDPSSFGEGTDWQSLIYRPAFLQNHQLSVSGGDESTQFYISGNYTEQEGVVESSGFKRYSFRTNLNKDVSEQLTVGSNLSVARAINNLVRTSASLGTSAAGVRQGARLFLPVLDVFDEQGNYTASTLGTLALGLPFQGVLYENPVAFIQERNDETTTNRLFGNAFAEYRFPLEGLSLRVSLGADITDDVRKTYAGNRLTIESSSQGTTYRMNHAFLTNDNLLKYQRTFGERHALNLTAGFTWQRTATETQFLRSGQFVTDLTKFNDLGSGNSSTYGLDSGRGESTLASWLGRVNYVFNDKYLLTLTGRRDGSSRFGSGNRWAFFPSGALAWRLSEEPFIQDVGLFSNLKARVSYGLSGNQEIGNYASLARLGAASYTFGGAPFPGYIPSSFANPDLKWETTRQFDVGLDVGLFGQRLRLTADYYRKFTEDLLLPVALPFESGFASSLQNTGSMRNVGYDLALGADLFPARSFSWNTNANFSANQNEIVDLGESGRFRAPRVVNLFPGGLVEEGVPLGAFFGYKTGGIFNDQEEVDAHGVQPNAQPGDIKFIDVNGDGAITPNDRTILGNPSPDYVFGWTNNFSYKGVTLSAFLQGVLGADVLNTGPIINDVEYGDVTYNSTVRRFKNRWTPENRDGTYPRAGYTETDNPVAALYTDRAVEDGSYLRLKTLTLGYRLPAEWLQRVGARSARVYLKGKNLLTLTDYTGPDPDVNSQGQDTINRGVDAGAYPLYRTYTIGVNLGF